MNEIRYNLHGYTIAATVKMLKKTWTTFEVRGKCPICRKELTSGKKVEDAKRYQCINNFKNNMATHFNRAHQLK